MRLLSDLSIASKLSLAFGLILCCTAGFGLFATQRLDAVNAAGAEIRDNWLPSTRALGQVAQRSERLRAYQSAALLAETNDERRARDAKAVKVAEDLRAALKAYEPLVSPGEEERLAGELTRAWSAYEALSTQLAGLPTGQQPGGNRERALALYMGEMQTAIDALRAAVQASADFNVREGTKAGDRGAAVASSAHDWILAVLALATVLCIAIGWSVVRGVSGPVSGMTAAMRRLADQDLAVEVPGVGRGDEIGAMAGAVQVFKDNALRAREMERERAEAQARRAAEDERVRREAEDAAAAEAAALVVVGSIGAGLEKLAEGDLTHRLDTPLPGAYEPLRANLNRAVAQLQELVRGIASNTQAIRSGTGEVARASDDLSRRTEQQAASLEETAAALDQITATVRKTADGAGQAREAAAQTRADAERSGGVVRQAVEAMGGSRGPPSKSGRSSG